MSHAGRRIASAAAVTAAIAVPVVAAASAQADSLPVVGSLPAVGTLAQGLPVGDAIPVNGMLGSVNGGNPLSTLPVQNLPVVGGAVQNLPLVGGQSSAADAPAQAAAPVEQAAQQLPAQAYVAKHKA
ncbi:hypothetical protein KDK95_17220 [Actinospica sp. MGRD01-02]|uniref:ATP-binding protein n=1 Tax=Actinospica acidithermotolerans TaxID=2828514 RepID=A0A941EAN7_9ACTN|nr:hypothetical protein [Actinospica acidithermotolerans]MBR7828061.1 hypothetical protein [Actinospica acidithermotolerans]